MKTRYTFGRCELQNPCERPDAGNNVANFCKVSLLVTFHDKIQSCYERPSGNYVPNVMGYVTDGMDERDSTAEGGK